MVATVRDPGNEALEREVAGLEDTSAQAEARNGTKVLVHVVDRLFAAKHPNQVLRETLRLTDSVLGVRNAEAADTATGQIRNGRDVSGSPGTVDNIAVGVNDAQRGLRTNTTALFGGQVTGTHHLRVGHHTGRPHDDVGRDDVAC
ncbi:hypothetical protein DC31_08795 [Microbacterium sp. CH12i]|nr:hypothetical protein DC31_08795 [Microbacterium sp. CH12i]